MNNKPYGWVKNGEYVLYIDKPDSVFNYIPLYTHPVNPYQSITNTKIEPTVVSYTHPVKEQITKENHVWDKGIWTVGQTESQEFIESSDFNHDVRLYLNGDFEDDTQRLNYLKHIADRLNAIDAFL